MNKKFWVLIVLIAWFPVFATSQNISEFDPVDIVKPNLTPERINDIKRQQELFSRDESKLTEKEKNELNGLIRKYNHDEWESGWDIISVGCSWYCAGGNYQVNASSFLKSQGENVYDAKSANDLSYQTAWIEGAEGDGLGESIAYTFKNESPRITAVIVSNGYMKTEKTWKNNGRVKKLKVYENDHPIAVLNLKDLRADQKFEIGTLGRRADGKDLILKFELLEVYPGDKYEDTAITEIYFDGIDVH